MVDRHLGGSGEVRRVTSETMFAIEDGDEHSLRHQAETAGAVTVGDAFWSGPRDARPPRSPHRVAKPSRRGRQRVEVGSPAMETSQWPLTAAATQILIALPARGREGPIGAPGG